MLHRTGQRAAAGMEYALIVGLIGAIAIVAVMVAGTNVSRLLGRTANTLAGVGNTTATTGGGGGTSTGSTTPASCAALKSATPTLSGISVQTIRPGAADIQAVCDFSTFGGGWTLVAAQYEADPIPWTEGRQADYDPTLGTSRSFALIGSEIPAHAQTAFGRIQSGFTGAMIDAIAVTYSTGDIALNSYPGVNAPATSYWLHRSATSYYGCHDPDSPAACGGLGNDPNWNNTLTFNTVTPGTYVHTWAFSPGHSSPASRGYAFNAGLSGSSESYAWGVWVR